ncbi:MAG TPA: class I SAM-dependent methyltransferase [Gaiellaceae bacterium]
MAGASPPAPDFGEIAASYDRLRPVDENWWELFDVLVREGDLLGRRALDIGCGTGTFALALAERGGKVWGVDASPEMIARARSKGARSRFKEGRAESLPFKDAWFERAVLRLSLHHLDRPRALAEVRRVLVPGGRVVIATFDPDHFQEIWLNELFPSIAAIDRARFPDAARVASELEAAGFGPAEIVRVGQSGTLSRAQALDRIRGRYISTLRMLDDDEFESGLAEAEATLPDELEPRIEWLVVSAETPAVDAVRGRR